MTIGATTMPITMPFASDDRTFVDRVYRSMGRAAIAKTQRLVNNQELAEEIVHETFTKLWSSRLKFPSDKAAFMWVYTTCHRAGIDYLRSGKHQFEKSSLDEAAHVANDEQDVAANRQLLRTYLKHLNNDEAALIAYLHIDGMNQQEAAEAMNISRKTVIRMCQRIESRLAQVQGEHHATV